LVGRVGIDVLWKPDRAVENLQPLRKSIDALELAGDHASLALAWFAVANVEAVRLEFGAVEEALDRGLHHARLSGAFDQRLIAMRIGITLFGPTPVREAIALSEALLPELPPSSLARGNILANLGLLIAMQRRFDEGRRVVLEGIQILEKIGLESYFGAAPLRGQQLGLLEEMAGDLVASEREFRAGVEASTRIGDQVSMSSLALWLADVLIALGRHTEAQEMCEQGRRASATDDLLAQVQWRGVRARLMAIDGAVEDAVALAREGVQLIDATDVLTDRARAYVRLAETLHTAGDPTEAHRAAKRALELFREKGALAWEDRVNVLMDQLS
jgi:tetratricopeptide (TPR) repeat protein